MKRVLTVALALVGVVAAAAPAFARHRYAFIPGQHGAAHGARHGGHGFHSRGRHSGASRSRGGAGVDEGAGAPPPPGSGFKMEDGVLTYPAPARFQPRNLKHP